MDIIEKNQRRIEELASTSLHLAKQAEELNWSDIQSALEECIFNKDEIGLPKDYGPAAYFPLIPESTEQSAIYKKAYLYGESLIQDGKIAAFIVAGGQGTRLGYDGPKGTLPVSPIKNKPLFQLFAEQIRGASEKYETVIPWYIMCSPLNLEATISHFEENSYYGLAKEDIKFFAQGVMPATDLRATYCSQVRTALLFLQMDMAAPSKP